MKKVAVLSDIHGNVTALEAVLADATGATDYWILGDLLMPGCGSSDILATLQKLPNQQQIRGNWEDNLLAPSNIFQQHHADYQNLSAKSLDFFRSLPVSRAFEFQCLKVLLCHNLPEKNSGKELHFATAKELEAFLLSSGCDLAIFGHTHKQRVEYFDKGRAVLNPGSVGLNYGQPGFADYALLNFFAGKVAIELKSVPYDMERELRRAEERNLPHLAIHRERLLNGKTETLENLIKKVNQG